MKSNLRIKNIEKRMKNQENKFSIPLFVTKLGERYYRGSGRLKGEELTKKEIDQITGNNQSYHDGKSVVVELLEEYLS